MAALFGTLGFITSLVAVWFTAAALQRADEKNDVLVRPHLRPLKSDLMELRGLLQGLDKRMGEVERQINILKHDQTVPPALEAQARAIRHGVDEAQRFTPTQTRPQTQAQSQAYNA